MAHYYYYYYPSHPPQGPSQFLGGREEPSVSRSSSSAAVGHLHLPGGGSEVGRRRMMRREGRGVGSAAPLTGKQAPHAAARNPLLSPGLQTEREKVRGEGRPEGQGRGGGEPGRARMEEYDRCGVVRGSMSQNVLLTKAKLGRVRAVPAPAALPTPEGEGGMRPPGL